MEGDDVRMTERRDGLRLATETLETIRVGGELGRQNLEGDAAIQACVFGGVHLAHAAGPQPFEDPIVQQRAPKHARSIERSRGSGLSAHRCPLFLESVTTRSPVIPVQRSRCPSGHCTTTAATAADEPSPKCKRTSLADK